MGKISHSKGTYLAMAAHTKIFIGLTATALLVVIGAGFYEMDRRGRSQFEDLAARVEEVDSSLSQLRRDLRAETTARTTLRTDVRRDMTVLQDNILKLRNDLTAIQAGEQHPER